jgi:predicted rRNA methylase YqxC with S4 and FtsJ domains
MMVMKKLNMTITTLGDFRNATKNLDDDLQLCVCDRSMDTLDEILEVMLVLPKTDEENPFLIIST